MENNQSLSTSAAQQFCLRWHNHQTSLLSSLPLLLDQSHLTDVTLSAEGRTIRAHRIVLSACSTFFLDLFQTLESPLHPVIVLPGASFGTMVALLTFMYSGEVNVYEEQISELLALAATLGIKGLADFNGNISKTSPKCSSPQPKEPEATTPQSSSTPPTSTNKLSFPLEQFFTKTFPFCPSLLGNPLGFTQSALTRGAELFARYQSQCRLNSGGEYTNEALDENGNQKFATHQSLNHNNGSNKKHKSSNLNKIDKIAENLRSASTAITDPSVTDLSKSSAHFMDVDHNINEDQKSQKSQQQHHHHHHHPHQQQSPSSKFSVVDTKSAPPQPSTPDSNIDKSMPVASAGVPLPKSVSSKLYATCFICHKQLSNQYNLRVHLETHQNVRYACNVCSHVSRSKDALRKHVSYRHPGAPSPCESEARRKRSKGVQQHAASSGTGMHHNKSDDLTSDQSTLAALQQQQQHTQHPHPLLALQHHLSAAQCFLNEEQHTSNMTDSKDKPAAAAVNSLDQLDESPIMQ